MGLLDRLLGKVRGQQGGQTAPGGHAPTGDQVPAQQQFEQAPPAVGQTPPAGGQPAATPQQDADARAVQRYEYLLRTARPEQLEQAHTEAFAQLTPAQRQQVLEKLRREDPENAPQDDSPQALGRSATRMEMRRPGTLQHAFGGPSRGGMAIGMGGMLLTAVAGSFIGTAIAQEMFDEHGDGEMEAVANDTDLDGDGAPDSGDGVADAGYDGGGYDAGEPPGGGFEPGGGFDAGGGGFDGGGFGGGDFGGGDFGGGF